MKKNLVIIFLSIFVAFLIYQLMNPAVITQRRMELQNKNTDNSMAKNIEESEPPHSLQKDYYPQEFFDSQNSIQEDDTESENTIVQDNENPPLRPIRFIKKIDDNFYTKEKQNISESFVSEEDININKQHEPKSDKSLGQILKICKPYKETMHAKYLGVDMDYEIEILGWIDSKCVINFTSQMTGIANTFEQLYGLSPEDVTVNTFAPNIVCKFTKNQLLWAGDSILQEQERNDGKTNNMLKNPEEIKFPEFNEMSLEDAKLLQLLMGSDVCKITNIDELKKVLDTLLNF